MCLGKTRQSIRNDSFFVRSHYTLFEQMKIICCFCEDVRVSVCARHLQIGRTALTDYYDNLRGEYLDEIQSMPIQFSGSIFEVDEVLLKHVRTKEGGFVSQWIFGIVERDTGKLYYTPVENRSASVLIHLIQNHIPSGSLIFSDEWSSYRKLDTLGYRHFTVNHSKKEYSRDEEIDGRIVKVNINKLEGMNRALRQRFANKSSRTIERLELVLGEIIYRYSGRSMFSPFKV